MVQSTSQTRKLLLYLLKNLMVTKDGFVIVITYYFTHWQFVHFSLGHEYFGYLDQLKVKQNLDMFSAKSKGEKGEYIMEFFITKLKTFSYIFVEWPTWRSWNARSACPPGCCPLPAACCWCLSSWCTRPETCSPSRPRTGLVVLECSSRKLPALTKMLFAWWSRPEKEEVILSWAH